jgi:hypothetical protein
MAKDSVADYETFANPAVNQIFDTAGGQRICSNK